MKYCSKCGAKLADEARFCTNCGEPVLPTIVQTTPLDSRTNDENVATMDYVKQAEPINAAETPAETPIYTDNGSNEPTQQNAKKHSNKLIVWALILAGIALLFSFIIKMVDLIFIIPAFVLSLIAVLKMLSKKEIKILPIIAGGLTIIALIIAIICSSCNHEWEAAT